MKALITLPHLLSRAEFQIVPEKLETVGILFLIAEHSVVQTEIHSSFRIVPLGGLADLSRDPVD
jgi:hypothetical protein